MKKILRNEKGNIGLVFLFVMVMILVISVLSNQLITYKWVSRQYEDKYLMYSNEVSSVIEIMKSNLLYMIKNKEIHWELGIRGQDVVIITDMESHLFKGNDFVKFLNKTNVFLKSVMNDTGVYVSNIESQKIKDVCQDNGMGLVCDGFTDIMIDFSIQKKKDIYRFKLKVEGIRVYSDLQHQLIKFDVDDANIKFEKVGEEE